HRKNGAPSNHPRLVHVNQTENDEPRIPLLYPAQQPQRRPRPPRQIRPRAYRRTESSTLCSNERKITNSIKSAPTTERFFNPILQFVKTIRRDSNYLYS